MTSILKTTQFSMIGRWGPIGELNKTFPSTQFQHFMVVEHGELKPTHFQLDFCHSEFCGLHKKILVWCTVFSAHCNWMVYFLIKSYIWQTKLIGETKVSESSTFTTSAPCTPLVCASSRSATRCQPRQPALGGLQLRQVTFGRSCWWRDLRDSPGTHPESHLRLPYLVPSCDPS